MTTDDKLREYLERAELSRCPECDKAFSDDEVVQLARLAMAQRRVIEAEIAWGADPTDEAANESDAADEALATLEAEMCK